MTRRLLRAADGRWFWQTRAADVVADGTPRNLALYVSLPPDGREYIPNLSFELGQTDVPIMTSLA